MQPTHLRFEDIRNGPCPAARVEPSFYNQVVSFGGARLMRAPLGAG
jgi:hypothetical protein